VFGSHARVNALAAKCVGSEADNTTKAEKTRGIMCLFPGKPMILRCDEKLGYVEIGEITANSGPPLDISLKNAKKGSTIE